MCINPKLYLVNINACAKCGQNLSTCYQDIEQKRNSNINWRKMMRNNHININAYAKFCYIPSIRFQDIERKQSFMDGMTESQNDGQPGDSIPVRQVIQTHVVLTSI